MPEYTTISLHSNCVAQLTGNGVLTIFEGDAESNGILFPAKSLVLSGKSITNLRDLLNGEFRTDDKL